MVKYVDVIIPAYKNPEQLEKCKAAINKCVDFMADNGKEILVELKVIDNSEDNRGFSKAVNIQLRDSVLVGADYAIILNQDCYLAPDAISEMVAFMDEHPKCFHASIKQLSSQDQNMIIHGGTLECYPAGRHISGLVSNNDCKDNKRMQWANAACLIVNVKHLLDVGLLDENMFLIGCDSDWSYRARAAGFEVWYIGSASCVHEQGITRGNGDKDLSKRMYLDMVYWRTKWIGADLYRELSLEVFD